MTQKTKRIVCITREGYTEVSYNGILIGEVTLNTDGFYVLFLDKKISQGYVEPWLLRELADYLDEINLPWRKELEENLK